ncbi:MAG: alpha/beta fold hydrolase [Phycisphaerales bacterium]|nr:MAG: alpha/beta fold hydrolase [Phycisphaerales bacterium]
MDSRPFVQTSPDFPSALFPFTSRYLDLDGIRMHYVDEGRPDAPPVLLLHGNPTWSFFYRDIIRDLRATHRVIAPDHVGCGLSDKPRRYPYRLATHVDNVEKLIDALRLVGITLGVHDWGGAIGFGLACRRPQRFRRFIVFNAAAFFGPAPWRIRVCRWPLVGALIVRGFNGFARPAATMAVRRRLPPDVRAGFLAPYRCWGDRVAIWSFVKDIPTRPSHPSWAVIESIDGSLPQFRDRPTLICWGMRDFCFDADFLEGWRARFPEAEVHRFEDAGHYLLEDAGDRIVPLVRAFVSEAASEHEPPR